MLPPRAIGDSRVNAVGLGCMNVSHAYGPAQPEDDAVRLFRHALDVGYDFFDTATIYGLGTNEALLGKAIAHRRSEFFLASKCVMGMRDGKRVLDGRPENLKSQCDDSLKRLQTDVIDLYYMHRLDRSVPIEDSVGALAEMVAAGKIRHIGLSEMSAATLRRACAVHPIAAMQSEYSLWTRNPELGVLDACAELGVTFVAFSPVGRGFFADEPLQPDAFHETDLRGSMPRFQPDNYAQNLLKLDAVGQLAADLGCGIPEIALGWLMAQGEHVVTIPGTTRIDHLEQNFNALRVELPESAVEQLTELFAPQSVAGNRYSNVMQRTVDTEVFDFEVYED
ncbi:MAG: aldo/keto reductase [Pseudomonadales bacterium]|nr:aldo/keto reductase [Pseudomonadales bacterium]NIX07466.1 aldo/keto reductase [Pseudomonadales bacterium]